MLGEYAKHPVFVLNTPKNKVLNKTLFWSSVNEFIFTNALNPVYFSNLVGCTAQQGRRWINRKSVPSLEKLSAVCEKLNWDYDSFFASGADLSLVEQIKLPTFANLTKRYLQFQKKNPSESVLCENLAGALALHCLTTFGLVASLEVDAQLQTRINFSDMDGIWLSIFGDVNLGLRMALMDGDNKIIGERHQLNEKGLNICRSILNEYASGNSQN